MKTTLQNFFKSKKNKVICFSILAFTILAGAGFYLNSRVQEQKKIDQARIEKENAEEQAKKEQEEKERIELAKAEEKKKAEELEKEQQKQTEEEKNKEIKKMTDKKDNKIKSNKKGIKNLVEMYLAKNNIKYNDWLAEKHQELLNEMIEKDLLIIKGENK